MIAYNNYCPTTLCGWRESTLVTVSTQSSQVATILCCIFYFYALLVSNYEISLWQYHFLRLWLLQTSKPYLQMKDIFSLLKVPYVDIFQLYDGKITTDNIITFLWLFVFLDIDNLTRILLSIHGFQSNISITFHQCLEFFHSLNPFYVEDELVSSWLFEHQEDSCIKINEIVNLMGYSRCLTSFLKMLKESLTTQFFGKNGYQKIQMRIRYFNDMYKNKKYKIPPKESFFTKLNRMVLTKKPPPYYSDYRNFDTNHKKVFGNLMFDIRREFGYSRRLETLSVPQLLLKRMSKPSKMININQKSELEIVIE